MRMLVATTLPSAALDELRALTTDMIYKPDLTGDALTAEVKNAAILIVGSQSVSQDTISGASALQLIVRAGTGVSNIAVDEASTLGILVSHCPFKEADAIAELTIGMILALDRRLVENAQAYRDHAARKPGGEVARGLAGRSLGILGFDALEPALVRRAKAFDMQVLAWARSVTSEARDRDVELVHSPRELARRVDVLAAFSSLAGMEEPLLSMEVISNMRDGAYLVHIGHPSGIDEGAALRAAQAKNLRLAADFSVADGSVRPRCRLLEVPQALVTFQLAGRTQQAADAAAQEVVRVVRQYLVAGEVLHCLNLAERSPATWLLVLRLRDAVGVMASIMEAIRADGINAEEITSRVFTGARAAWCTVALDERPSTEALDSIRGIQGVLHLELRAVI